MAMVVLYFLGPMIGLACVGYCTGLGMVRMSNAWTWRARLWFAACCLVGFAALFPLASSALESGVTLLNVAFPPPGPK